MFIAIEGFIVLFSIFATTLLIIGPDVNVNYSIFGGKIFIVFTIYIVCLYYNDIYDFNYTDSILKLSIRLFQGLGQAALFLAVVYFIFPDLIIAKNVIFISIFTIIVSIGLWRYFYTSVVKNGMFNQKILIIGDSSLADTITREIKEKKDCGYTVFRKLHITGREHMEQTPECLSPDICEIAKTHDVEKIIVALKEKRGTFPTRQLLKCRINGIDVIDGNSFYESLSGKLLIDQIDPGWFIFSKGFTKSKLLRALKRLIDIIVSLCSLILLFPLIICVSILIKIDSKGSIIFSQERVGEERKPYHMHKFRSMVANAEEETGPVWAEDGDQRITRVGNFLRKTRMDEIPQLWNVLKGEMSLVGPRPEREFFVKELERSIPYYPERFSVKPGITGWAQIKYHYASSVQDSVEKLKYDLFYIKNLSIFLDLIILIRTLKIILFQRGAR